MELLYAIYENRVSTLHVHPWKPAFTPMSMKTSSRNFERKDLILYNQYRVSFNYKSTIIESNPF